MGNRKYRKLNEKNDIRPDPGAVRHPCFIKLASTLGRNNFFTMGWGKKTDHKNTIRRYALYYESFLLDIDKKAANNLAYIETNTQWETALKMG